jgi:hypothetical protein
LPLGDPNVTAIPAPGASRPSLLANLSIYIATADKT